jgi:hypothetical protein
MKSGFSLHAPEGVDMSHRSSWARISTQFVKSSLIAACCFGALGGCLQPKAMQSGSQVKTTDIAHSTVKWQSIGNCWIYAIAGWTESLMLYNGKEVDISESYITYNHFLEEILQNPSMKEMETGGNWWIASNLMAKYGVMFEGDFIPDESNKTCSLVQKNAVAKVNEMLKSGAFAKDPTRAGIRKLLDQAFGVDSAALKDKVIPASKIQLADGPGLIPNRTLEKELNSWQMESWHDSGNFVRSNTTLGVGTYKLSPTKKALLTRVKKALNDQKPVLISWFVDFNAMDNNGIFSLSTLVAKGALGRQGGHMTVIEDYVAHGVDPVSGEAFQTKEGKETPALKKLAAEVGEIDYLVVKNSWGGAGRYDRPSYTHDGMKGFTRLNADYLFGFINETESGNIPRAVITSFVLPAGY